MRYLIVGGTSGIGLKLVELLKDHELEILARSPKELSLPHSFHAVDVCDLSKELPALDGALNGIVYLPGTITLKPFQQVKIEDFKRDWEINCLGAFRVIQHYLPLLSKDPVSSIVLLSTVAVGVGMNYHTSIASAKGALEAFARSLAADLAPSTRVNVVAPSLTETPLASRLLGTDSLKEAAAKRHPLKRHGAPEDIASMIRFLLSKESNWITGQVIGVDGGLSKLKLL